MTSNSLLVDVKVLQTEYHDYIQPQGYWPAWWAENCSQIWFIFTMTSRALPPTSRYIWTDDSDPCDPSWPCPEWPADQLGYWLQLDNFDIGSNEAGEMVIQVGIMDLRPPRFSRRSTSFLYGLEIKGDPIAYIGDFTLEIMTRVVRHVIKTLGNSSLNKGHTFITWVSSLEGIPTCFSMDISLFWRHIIRGRMATRATIALDSSFDLLLISRILLAKDQNCLYHFNRDIVRVSSPSGAIIQPAVSRHISFTKLHFTWRSRDITLPKITRIWDRAEQDKGGRLIRLWTQKMLPICIWQWRETMLCLL